MRVLVLTVIILVSVFFNVAKVQAFEMDKASQKIETKKITKPIQQEIKRENRDPAYAAYKRSSIRSGDVVVLHTEKDIVFMVKQ